MAASYTSTCYLIDISPSMSNPLDLGGVTKSRLEWALEFVKTKLAQRLINPKATDVTAVVTFGGAETNNSLAADPDKDGYDCIQELLPMRPPTLDDLHRVADIEVGTENVDIIAALYVAGELLRNSGAKRKDTKKVIVLITDCDEPKAEGDGGAILTDWEDEDWTNPLLQGIIPGLNGSRKGEPREYFTLGVM